MQHLINFRTLLSQAHPGSQHDTELDTCLSRAKTTTLAMIKLVYCIS
jgi:hypothetical protein